jgi:transposase
VDAVTAGMATVQARIDAQVAPFADVVARLDAIPGVGVIAAQTILAEIGTDMARFAPGVSESAGRPRGKPGTGHGNRYLARALGEAAVGAARADTFLGERYRRIARRRGKNRAIVAVGRSLLVIVGALLSDEDAQFADRGPTATPPAPTPNARSPSTSANCRPSATPSPSTPQPDRVTGDFRISGPPRDTLVSLRVGVDASTRGLRGARRGLSTRP